MRVIAKVTCARRSAVNRRWRSDDGDEVYGKEGKRDSLSPYYRESAAARCRTCQDMTVHHLLEQDNSLTYRIGS